MANAAKAKGDRVELEAAALLTELLGVPCRRKLGAGRLDDTGDIDGIAGTVIQVGTQPSDPLRYVWEKPMTAEQQRLNDGATFAASFIWLPRRGFRVCLTPEQWAAYARAVP